MRRAGAWALDGGPGHFVCLESRIAADGSKTILAAGFQGPSGLEFDRAGSLYVVNEFGNSISKIAADGTVTEFAQGLRTPLFIAIQPAPVPPRLRLASQSAESIRQEGLRFFLSGETGGNYRIDWSADLAAWAPLQTKQLTSVEAEIADPAATNAALRFYRAATVP